MNLKRLMSLATIVAVAAIAACSDAPTAAPAADVGPSFDNGRCSVVGGSNTCRGDTTAGPTGGGDMGTMDDGDGNGRCSVVGGSNTCRGDTTAGPTSGGDGGFVSLDVTGGDYAMLSGLLAPVSL